MKLRQCVCQDTLRLLHNKYNTAVNSVAALRAPIIPLSLGLSGGCVLCQDDKPQSSGRRDLIKKCEQLCRFLQTQLSSGVAAAQQRGVVLMLFHASGVLSACVRAFVDTGGHLEG